MPDMIVTDDKQLFVSVGTRFAMDRLLSSVDEVLRNHAGLRATAQIGPSHYTNNHIDSPINATQWMDANTFEQQVSGCDAFISHAGIGNILLAVKYNKPIIIMPRSAHLKEHVNDHQMATARAMHNKPFVHVVKSSAELENAILRVLATPDIETTVTQSSNQQSSNKGALVSAVKHFIDHGKL